MSMTPERLAEARYFIGVEPGMVGVIARAVLAERDEFAAEVERLRAQVTGLRSIAAEHAADFGQGDRCVCEFCVALASDDEAGQ